jgi:hypothetical protein
LIDEWNPVGPTQRDAVFDLADSKWRKRRLARFVQTQLSLNTFDPYHPAYNEATGLGIFLHYLRSEPETCFEEHARKCLRDDRIDDLKRKFPRSRYQTTAEWVEALTIETLPIARPAVPECEPAEPEAEIDGLKEAAREWKTDCQVSGSIIYGRELFEYEFKEIERLDARIARQIKFLVTLKAMQNMLSEV